jgi:hypothetical protein
VVVLSAVDRAVLFVTDTAALAAGDTNGTWDAYILQGVW